MSVTRFLVSGTDKQLTSFHLAVCMTLNAIERRGQTIFYTCMGEDRETALDTAKAAGVTMQEMDANTRAEKWSTVVQGEHPGWKPRTRRSSNDQAETRRKEDPK